MARVTFLDAMQSSISGQYKLGMFAALVGVFRYCGARATSLSARAPDLLAPATSARVPRGKSTRRSGL